MGWGFKRTLRTGSALVLICAAALAVSTATAAADDRTASLGAMPNNDRAAYIEVGETARAPIGWVEFCVRYKGECNTRPSAPRDVVLTQKAWSDMVKVNSWANDNIQPITDRNTGAWSSNGIIPTMAKATAKTMCCSSGAC